MASHGFAIQTWLNYVSGYSIGEMREWVLDNVSVSKFVFDGQGCPFVSYIGDNRHLTEQYRCNYDWERLADTPLLLIYDSDCQTCKEAVEFLERSGITYECRDIRMSPLLEEEKKVLEKRCRKKLGGEYPLLVSANRGLAGFESRVWTQFLEQFSA